MNPRLRFAATILLSLALPPSAKAGTVVYPLKKSANRRYLVDQNNAPSLLLGDSPQALMVNLSESDADEFFSNRSSYGFNTVWINLLCSTYTGGRADASTFDGIVPFTQKLGASGSYDLTRPNETYFARVDTILNSAARNGIQVLLDPAETGSFLSVMRANGTDRCRAYGQYLGKRYKSAPNIIWMSGNDFQSWRTSNDDTVVRSVALGIQDNDTNHLQTTELDYVVSSSLDDTNWNGIIGLNATYTYYPTYARLRQDYSRTNFLPTFLVEANYEFESLQGPITTPPILRKQEYWTMTSGACGQLYGNHYTWPFSGGWQENLDTPGAAQIAYLKAFFEPRAWYALVPDLNHSVVPSGYGTFSATGFVADNNFLTAARTSDGTLVVVYTPIIRQFTVDLSQLSAPAVTRWFDPSSGTFAKVDGSPLLNTGIRDFIPPGNNHDGDGGWVLVLETNPPPDPPPSAPRPQLIQQAYSTPQTPQSSVLVTYPNPQAPGNANILAIGWNDVSTSLVSVDDSAGNIYQEAIATFRGHGLSQAICFATNIKPGSNMVTVFFDQPATFVDIRALEYSGCSSTNAFAGGTSASGRGNIASSGSLDITSTNQLLFAAGMTSTTFVSAGTGFNQRIITAPDSDIVQDKIAGSIGNYEAKASLTDGEWLMQLAAFRAAPPLGRAPALRISLTATNDIIVAWPADSGNFSLQRSLALANSGWLDITNPVSRIEDEKQVTLTPGPTNQFYRLILR